MNVLLFSSMLFVGTVLFISAGSWLTLWVGMELNFICFVPLMSGESNSLSSEGMTSYFLVNSLSSLLFLLGVFLNCHTMVYLDNFMVLVSMLISLGAAPFHVWMPFVVSVSSFFSGLILMTWQSLLPLCCLSALSKGAVFPFIFLSLVFGSWGGLNQLEMSSILAFSSISHLGWILGMMFLEEGVWVYYFVVYCLLLWSLVFLCSSLQLLTISHLMGLNSSYKSGFMLNFLSMGGFPPLVGFWPSLSVLMMVSFYGYMFLGFVLILSSVINLYFYLRIGYTVFLGSYGVYKVCYLNCSFYQFWWICLLPCLGLLLFL